MTDKTLKTLRAQAQKLGDKISKIESDAVCATNAPLIGKTFKRSTNYSNSRTWWQYAKIVRMDKYGLLFASTFEIDCDGRLSSDPDNMVYHAQDYTRIPASEYERAKRRFAVQARSLP